MIVEKEVPLRFVVAHMKSHLLPLIASLSVAAIAHTAVPGGDVLGGLILKHFDSNSDGMIDAGEWHAGMTASFADMDLNGDGSISGGDVDGLKKELTDELGDIGATVAAALIKQIVMALDKDGDKLVSQKEFTEGGEAMFKKLDANKDGQASKEELADLPARVLK